MWYFVAFAVGSWFGAFIMALANAAKDNKIN